MEKSIWKVVVMLAVAIICVSCDDKEELKYYEYVPCTIPTDSIMDRDSELWLRHHDTPLKILAIGNSFTNNATNHLPWMIKKLNGNSICIARLMQSGCSLERHWKNHIDIANDYNLQYSYEGGWENSEITNIDRALMIFDWDIIVIQQASPISGIYSTYQPSLNFLVRLFNETNPNASLAWHYTWAYRSGTDNDAFKDYDSNPAKMYNAIIDAGNKASMKFDIRIPSATLIKMLREEFSEIENGFSEDGVHVDGKTAQCALASLWYECLIRPYAGTSILDYDKYPAEIEAEDMVRVNNIIREILNI